jgi:hypothetical protein
LNLFGNIGIPNIIVTIKTKTINDNLSRILKTILSLYNHHDYTKTINDLIYLRIFFFYFLAMIAMTQKTQMKKYWFQQCPKHQKSSQKKTHAKEKNKTTPRQKKIQECLIKNEII